MLLKRKQTLRSHFRLISFTTIVGCNMHDCHHRKSLNFYLVTWIKLFIWYLSHISHIPFPTASCCSWSVSFPYFLPGGPPGKNKAFLSWEKCEWGNPNPNPVGQWYPQSCVNALFSTRPVFKGVGLIWCLWLLPVGGLLSPTLALSC